MGVGLDAGDVEEMAFGREEPVAPAVLRVLHGNSDSYYEYLLKGYVLLNDNQLFDMFMTLYYAIDVYNKVTPRFL